MRRQSLVIRALLVAAMLPLGGCFGLFGTRPGQTGLASKTVHRKEPPTSLIAIDYTRCLVSEEKFRNTPIGGRVTCYWTSDKEGRVVTGGGTTSSAAPEQKVSGTAKDMTAKGSSTAKGAAASKKPND